MPAKIKKAMLRKEERDMKDKGFISEDRYSFLKRFLRESMAQKVSAYTTVDKNESVLPSPLTRMVSFVVDEKTQTILTIDTDALVRVWSM
jgi:hypothetical protein